MSCRHDLALGTCRVCYPETGSLHPVGPGDSLNGPGALEDDPGLLRPGNPEDAPPEAPKALVVFRPMDKLLDAIILLAKLEHDHRTPRFKITITSEPDGWDISTKSRHADLASAFDDLTTQINRFIDAKLDEVHKLQEAAYDRYSKAREESSRLEKLVGEGRKP